VSRLHIFGNGFPCRATYDLFNIFQYKKNNLHFQSKIIHVNSKPETGGKVRVKNIKCYDRTITKFVTYFLKFLMTLKFFRNEKDFKSGLCTLIRKYSRISRTSSNAERRLMFIGPMSRCRSLRNDTSKLSIKPRGFYPYIQLYSPFGSN